MRIFSILATLILLAGYSLTPAVGVAASKDDILLVNKNNPLSSGYIPDSLVYPDVQFVDDRDYLKQVAANALEKMFTDAQSTGLDLFATSGYRSYNYQADLYQYYVDQYGEEYANRVSAKPGESEHQTGLAMDVTSPDIEYKLLEEFANTDEGRWVKAHAHEYGFIIRYPEGKESITGYKYEPWHLRYIGTGHAANIVSQDITLEEYLNTESSGGSEVYTVKSGDTLWGIARKHNMSLDKLMSLNPDLDPYRLMVGDKVKLSAKSESDGSQAGTFTYTVKTGDTLWGIAQDHDNVTVQDLLEANPSVEPKFLYVGQEISIPGRTTDGEDNISIVATGNVWIHRSADFMTSTRVGVFYKGEQLKLIGETANMYQTPEGYVSKQYAEKN